MWDQPGSKVSPDVVGSSVSVSLAPDVCTFGFQSALRGSPWGLMQALEQQVGELRVDGGEGGDGAPGEAGGWCSSHVFIIAARSCLRIRRMLRRSSKANVSLKNSSV